MKYNCNCKKSSNVFNGVCGKCLLPLKGVLHDPNGVIIEDFSKSQKFHSHSINHLWLHNLCTNCGYSKNKDNKYSKGNENSPCKGKINNYLKNEYDTAIYYNPELNELRVVTQNDGYDGDHDQGNFLLETSLDALPEHYENENYTFSNIQEANKMGWYKIGIL